MNYFKRVAICARWQKKTCVYRYNQTISALLLLLGNGLLSSVLFCVTLPFSILLFVKDWTFDLLVEPLFGEEEAFLKMESLLNKKSEDC